MSSTVSITAIDRLSERNLFPLTGSVSVSPESSAVAKKVVDIMTMWISSQFHGAQQQQTISSILEVQNECSEPNWDGYGALSVKEIAVKNSISFIRVFSNGEKPPEVAAEPDGSISLEWRLNNKTILSVSFGETDRLAYAWIDGSNKGYGVERFNYNLIPPKLAYLIGEFTNGAA